MFFRIGLLPVRCHVDPDSITEFPNPIIITPDIITGCTFRLPAEMHAQLEPVCNAAARPTSLVFRFRDNVTCRHVLADRNCTFVVDSCYGPYLKVPVSAAPPDPILPIITTTETLVTVVTCVPA